MSWASHNPELYDEIVRRGVQDMLHRRYPRHGSWLNINDEDEAYALDEIRETWNLRRVWDLLVDLSHREIVDREAEYFSLLVDAAHERYKGQRIDSYKDFEESRIGGAVEP